MIFVHVWIFNMVGLRKECDYEAINLIKIWIDVIPEGFRDFSW